MSNDEIGKKLEIKDKTSSFYSALLSEEMRSKFILYTSFVLIVLIFIFELGIIKIGKSKTSQIILQDTQGTGTSMQITDAGAGFVPAGQNEILVKSAHIYETSRIYITFKEDFSPATRFWVDKKIQGEGFVLKLDSPVLENSEFDWWVSN